MTDQTNSAGATPVAAGATPAQNPAQAGTPQSSAPTTPPATGDGDGQQLGEAGKAALDSERKARKAAETAAKTLQEQLDALKSSQLSDTEKAIAAARKEGATEVLSRIQGQIRASEVKAALTAAGVNSSLVSLAARADEFGALKVTDDGEVDGLDDAVGAFKKAHPDLFARQGTSGGSFDTGTGGGRQAGKPTYTREQLRDPKFFADNKADILAAQREGRIQAGP